MEARDFVERPRGGGRAQRLDAVLPQLGQNRVEIAGQMVDFPMEVVLERREPRFRALDPGLGGTGGIDADFGQALGLLAQLTGRLFVQETKGRPLAADGALEPLKAPGGVALKAAFDVVPAGETRFELADRLRVSLAGRAALLQDAGALIGELRQPPFDRFAILFGFARAQQGDREATDLRLQIDKALLQSGGLRKHGSPVGGMIVQNARGRSPFSAGRGAA